MSKSLDEIWPITMDSTGFGLARMCMFSKNKSDEKAEKGQLFEGQKENFCLLFNDEFMYEVLEDNII